VRIAKLDAARRGLGERCPCPLGDHAPLFLGERRIDVQHGRINVRPKLAHDEGHALSYQARNESHVVAEPIELGVSGPGRPPATGRYSE
jgi:hypothetical protein